MFSGLVDSFVKIISLFSSFRKAAFLPLIFYLKDLMNNPDVTLKATDKGSGLFLTEKAVKDCNVKIVKIENVSSQR